MIVAWRLDHHIWENIPMLEAYELLFKYLTSSKVSPFEAEFVQSEDPIASGVGFFSYKYSLPTLGLKFGNVPTNRTGRWRGQSGGQGDPEEGRGDQDHGGQRQEHYWRDQPEHK